MREYENDAAFCATCSTLYTPAKTNNVDTLYTSYRVQNRLSHSLAKFAKTEHTTMPGVDGALKDILFVDANQEQNTPSMFNKHNPLPAKKTNLRLLDIFIFEIKTVNIFPMM
jgi:hypothetical protein